MESTMESALGAGGFFLASVAICMFLKKSRKVVIEQLFIYPIKGCRGFEVKSAEMTPRGLEFDRSFVVINASTNQFISLRCHPKMALFNTRIDYEKQQVNLFKGFYCIMSYITFLIIIICFLYISS